MLQRIRVFCASPGDVGDERQAVEEIIRQLDRIWRDRGVTLEFDGLEGAGPSAGRPQDEINELVDACHVFVGLLNAHWGFPTGAYESGFEEEYERALARRLDSGTPELLIFFSSRSARDQQVALVEAFRERLQSTQEAYYREFANLDELRTLLHRRVEAYLTDLLQLGSPEQRPASVNWADVLSAGPVSRASDGVARRSAADAIADDDPGRAADLLEQLANELVELDGDVGPNVERLLNEAAVLRHRAGQVDAAIAGTLNVLRMRVSAGSELARVDAQRLRQWLSEDAHWIADTWESLVRWPEQVEDTISGLRAALASDHALVTDEDRHIWREQLAEILLWVDRPQDASADLIDLPAIGDNASDVLVRLHCLSAESYGFAGRPNEAARGWDDLVAWVDDNGDARPAIAGVILARHAVSLVRQERLAGAQRGFRAAAERWMVVEGADGEVGEQHFSSFVAAELLGELAFGQDYERAQALSMRSRKATPERTAERLLSAGLETRVTGDAFDALNRLTLAAQLHRRAGHFRGELRATRLLSELYEHVGESAAALAAAIQCGRTQDVKRLAASVEPEQLLDALDLEGPSWISRASLVALGAAGRRLSADQAASVAVAVKAAVEGAVTSMIDRDREIAAVEAVAALVHEWPLADRDLIVQLLVDAAISGDFIVASPAVRALQLRTNAHEGDHVEQLVEVMLDTRNAGQVSPSWVASHLRSHSEVVDRLERAAGEGSFSALETLCTQGPVGHLSGEIAAALDDRLRTFLARPLGRTPEGHIVGFLRLEPWGTLARYTTDESLRQQFADAIIEFITNDDEPHANRASATNALHNLAPSLKVDTAQQFLVQVRPLAEGFFGASLYDLPRDLAEHPFSRIRMGDEAAADRLQASALTACAALVTHASVDIDGIPWLAIAIDEALISDEAIVVAGAWEAVQRLSMLPVPEMITAHLLHPAPEVRVAALICWRIRRNDAPPASLASRIARDQDLNVRIALIGLLRDGNRSPELLTEMASDDADAYLRSSAAAPLPTQQTE
jgi:hypothetical protein